MNLHIITASSRPENLPVIVRSLEPGPASSVVVTWHVRFDPDQKSLCGQTIKNDLIGGVPDDDMVWVCDDDNLAHPRFLRALEELATLHVQADAFVFSQRLPDGGLREASPSIMQADAVDIAQVVFRRRLADGLLIDATYGGDSRFLAAMYARHAASFVFEKRPLVWYNRLRLDAD